MSCAPGSAATERCGHCARPAARAGTASPTWLACVSCAPPCRPATRSARSRMRPRTNWNGASSCHPRCRRRRSPRFSTAIEQLDAAAAERLLGAQLAALGPIRFVRTRRLAAAQRDRLALGSRPALHRLRAPGVLDPAQPARRRAAPDERRAPGAARAVHDAARGEPRTGIVDGRRHDGRCRRTSRLRRRQSPRRGDRRRRRRRRRGGRGGRRLPRERQRSRAALAALRAALPPRVELWVGGPGAGALALPAAGVACQ